ncbi:phosphopantetheine-binding protein [Thermomonospora umbrina]|uniref:Minimal PKS acyl carrier protein n=1 Tax=Thermomonospora umbrina TaxID=111806 RepID=A0A3D9SYD2_9ACTN|nr:phosphopantetheine-binding protein [Thermomonospora umbrina]REE97574.1 minimal PKS acyl carrier protein [Thermomonospora umbrina]
MAAQSFTDADVRQVLHAVGVPADDHHLTFEQLDVDSLALMEMATRIMRSHGVDIEELLTPDRTPAAMKALVNDLLSAG